MESQSTLNYITIDIAIHQILMFGPGTLLAKINIMSAFFLLSVHLAIVIS